MALLHPYFLLSALFLTLIYYVWACTSSPLRRLPGPTTSLFTSWVLKWHEFHANRTRYVHQLHETYGPIVRIGPNEVSFASSEGVKEIYSSGGSGYDKTEFYNLFQVYGRRYGGLFSMAFTRMLTKDKDHVQHIKQERCQLSQT